MTKASPIALAVLFACGMAAPALADRPGADWISVEQATQKAKDAGYTDIREMEADDGHWEGKGKKDGKEMEFHVDPKTGALSDEHADKDKDKD